MQEPNTVEVVGQASRWKEGLEAAIRERVREVIEEILHQEVEEALGARRSQRAVGRCGYRHGTKARGLALPLGVGNWSLTSLQQRLVKTGGRLIKHARYYWLLLAEGHLKRRLCEAMLRRIGALPAPAG